MADYAARIWLREMYALHRNPEDAAKEASQRPGFREDAQLVRAAIQRREFGLAFDLMSHGITFVRVLFRVLERAFPLMTDPERASNLRYVWLKSKERPGPTRALALFKAASSLRETVPAEWSAMVEVYRGTCAAPPLQAAHNSPGKAHLWLKARRRARRGIAWTTDRTVALKFATGLDGDIGCLATAMVPRDKVLAYFQDPEEVEFAGRRFPVSDGYHEHECIVDPATLTAFACERIDTADDREAE